jgi:CBS domain-containing protein
VDAGADVAALVKAMADGGTEVAVVLGDGGEPLGVVSRGALALAVLERYTARSVRPPSASPAPEA